MALGAGSAVGPYEVIAPVGKGGMGEVYRARDTRLDRDVAIKVSTSEFSERFTRETRSIAALNHLRVSVMAGDALTIARVERRQALGVRWVSHILQRLTLSLWSERTWVGVAASERFRIRSVPAIRVTTSTLLPDDARRFAADLADLTLGRRSGGARQKS